MGTLNRGGAETLAVDICHNAEQAGLDIVVIHRKGGALLEDFRDSGVEMIELRPRSVFDLGYLARLRKIVKHRSLDILHAHQVIDACYALLATAGMPTKVVLSLHGHGLSDGVLSGTLRRVAIANADRVLFVSNNQRQHYIERFGSIEHGFVCFNGLDFTKFNEEAKLLLRNEFKISNKAILLGAVGNFSSGRDQLTICRFLALLQLEDISFHFVFIGAASGAEPELYQQCVEYCQANGLAKWVTFIGSRSDVPSLLPQLDAFLYSTAHDTFGIAVVEAIAAGIPVFVNDWRVLREVTNEGSLATLYASKDTSDLLAKFLDFYANQKSYKEQAQLHALQVREQYSIEKYLTNLRQIYERLLTNSNSA